MSATGQGWRGDTYHGLPPLKRAHWDWKVGTYIFVAGLSGAAQLIALLGRGLDRAGGGLLRRQARAIGLVGSGIGATLLVWDLGTPKRFYNMLRILRPTSPMSFGTYVFGAFSASTIAGVLGDMLDQRGRHGGRRLAALAQLPAGIAGAGMSAYTAALLSATSNPYWAAAPRLMGARFGAASMASGAAALSVAQRLSGEEAAARRLDRLAMLASGIGLACSLAAEAQARRLGVRRDGIGKAEAAATLTLGEGAPLLGYLLGGMVPGLGRDAALLASLAVLAGGLAMRNDIIAEGNRAAMRPADYFRFAQPATPPEVTAPGRRP